MPEPGFKARQSGSRVCLSTTTPDYLRKAPTMCPELSTHNRHPHLVRHGSLIYLPTRSRSPDRCPQCPHDGHRDLGENRPSSEAQDTGWRPLQEAEGLSQRKEQTMVGWPAGSVSETCKLDLGIVSLSPTLGVEITKKII